MKQSIIQTEKQLKYQQTISLSSNNLDKYEYLTGGDLGITPSTAEQPKFEYSPLGKIFNKGLKDLTLPTKNCKCLKKIKYDKPSELKNALMDADEKEYYELKNNIKTTKNVLNEQIENKTGVKCTKFKNLEKAVKNVLDYVTRWHSSDLIDVELLNKEEIKEDKG